MIKEKIKAAAENYFDEIVGSEMNKPLKPCTREVVLAFVKKYREGLKGFAIGLDLAVIIGMIDLILVLTREDYYTALLIGPELSILGLILMTVSILLNMR